MSGSKIKISIVDYGVGNLYSLLKAFKCFTDNAKVTEEAEELKNSDAIILPGVGSFAAGMRGLQVRKLVDPVKEFADSGKPILGICLGAQIMLTKGYEFGEFDGLNLIAGKIVRFPKLPQGIKLPHIGWNKIYPQKKRSWKKTILEATQEDSSVYFIHSYILEPSDKEDIMSLATYGNYEFCSAIKRGNIYGCQFHPEKSGQVGLTIIKKFVSSI